MRNDIPMVKCVEDALTKMERKMAFARNGNMVVNMKDALTKMERKWQIKCD